MFNIRTWKIFAGDNFLGYEYSNDEAEVRSQAIKKFGAPQSWNIVEYTIELVPWPTEVKG